jgi:hypothetical protein
MPDPHTEVEAGGRKVPLYLLQFDKKGAPTSVAARKALLDGVNTGKYRDVYVFAHGWNNDFDDSFALFQRFFDGFLTLNPAAGNWKPVFVGVQWPSIVLVFPWEKGPQIAAAGAEAANADASFQKQAVEWIRGELGAADGKRFADLAAKPSLDEVEQNELARLARSAIRGDAGELADSELPSEAELLAASRKLQELGGGGATGDFGFAADPQAGPQAAGFLSALDPRNLVRTATVYVMKDRAGVIGSQGVKPLLEELTQADATVRVVGHSYGARVMLAALSTAALTKKVRSALLLQPAVNQYCFAESGQIPGSTRAGGFQRALDQVALPVYTTFSAKDFPLHDTFHLALRRGKDLGEAEIAAGAPPSIYCALGGYGPQGLNPASAAVVEIAGSGAYAYASTARVVALDGTQDRINGHGDVTNPYTFWALAEQDQRPV